MKPLKGIIFATIVSACALFSQPLPPNAEVGPATPLLNKVEHFYVYVDGAHAEKLFQLFRDEFELPQVWPYKDWGGYSGGGVSLGNVAMEIDTYPLPESTIVHTEFQGIIFEPVADADVTANILKSRGIAHDEPMNEKYKGKDGIERIGWVIIPYTDLPPKNVNVMLCDYKDRKTVAEGRAKAAKTLIETGGGPLGVVFLKEIVVGVEDVEIANPKWGLALGAEGPVPSNTFTFDSGPQIRLVKANNPGIQRIVVKIKSKSRAKQFLEKRDMLGEPFEGAITIKPSAIEGLMIVLVED